MFSQLSTPLILLIVGHDLTFNRKYAKTTILYTVIRKISFLGFGLLLVYFILPLVMEVSVYQHYAMITFFIMPPPLVISAFIRLAGGTEEQSGIAANVQVLDTAVCILSFVLLAVWSGMQGI
jgi:hypothetical protein